MTPHHRRQMGVLVADGLMPVYPTPSRNRRQRVGVPVLCRYLPNHILACPRLAPRVGKAEEGEDEVLSVSGWLVPFGLLSKSTKRLVKMECRVHTVQVAYPERRGPAWHPGDPQMPLRHRQQI